MSERNSEQPLQERSTNGRFKEQLPKWENEGIEPSEQKKQDGWEINEKPPSGWFNWLFHRTYQSLKELRNVFTEMDERVTPLSETVEEHEVRLEQIEADLNESNTIPLTIQRGTQLIEAPRDSLASVGFKGRTLVNYAPLFDSGLWFRGGGLAESDLRIDSPSKITMTATNNHRSCNTYINLRPNQIYTLSAKSNSVGSRIEIRSGHDHNGNFLGWSDNLSSFSTTFVSPPDGKVTIRLGNGGNGPGIYVFKDIMLNEGETPHEFVSNVQHLQGIVVECRSKNLLPPFDQWILHENATVINATKLVLKSNANDQFSYSPYFVVNEGQKYTLSLSENDAQAIIEFFDQDGHRIDVSNNAAIQTTKAVPAGATFMRVRLGNTSEGAGTFYFNSPQLELSANATDFEPGRVSSVFIKDTLGKWDEMLTDGYILKGGKYDVQLNGELDWKIRSSNFDGYRTIEINGGLLQSSSERYLVKYSGSLVPFFSSITEVNEGYDRAQWTSGGRFTISISNLETGWGENYTPSPDEIKVYFNGWKMYTQGEGRRSLYNGTGNKAWVKITRLKDNITPIDPNDITTTLPTTVADMDAQGNQYTPYKLSYKLLRPYVKTAELEGDLQVFKGKNHISLYEGTVVRERVSFENTDGAYVELNKEPHNNSYFKFKTYKIYNLYKNNDPVQLVRNSDKGWSLISDQLSYGRYRLSINRKLFDPTASYYVTYLVLDKHAYTTPIPEATLEYEGSLKSVVQRNTSQIAQNNRRLDVQEFWQRNVAVKGEGEVFQHGEVETTVNAGATATITIPFSRAYRYIPSITVSKGSSNSTIDLIDVSYRYDTKTRTSFTLLVKNNHAQSIRASVTWMAVGK